MLRKIGARCKCDSKAAIQRRSTCLESRSTILGGTFAAGDTTYTSNDNFSVRVLVFSRATMTHRRASFVGIFSTLVAISMYSFAFGHGGGGGHGGDHGGGHEHEHHHEHEHEHAHHHEHEHNHDHHHDGDGWWGGGWGWAGDWGGWGGDWGGNTMVEPTASTTEIVSQPNNPNGNGPPVQYNVYPNSAAPAGASPEAPSANLNSNSNSAPAIRLRNSP